MSTPKKQKFIKVKKERKITTRDSVIFQKAEKAFNQSLTDGTYKADIDQEKTK